MAHTLRLLRIENGTQTAISFTNFSYTPQHPKQTVETSSGSDDGSEISSNTFQNVQETLEVRLNDTTVPNLLAQIRTIGIWLNEAKERQKYRSGPQIYVEFTPHGSSDAFRSEILYGAYNLEDDALDFQILANYVVVQLQWERRYFWEGAEEWLTITNANGTGSGGSYLRVNNYNAGTGSSPNVDVAYVSVSSANVKGALPAKCRVEIRNPHASDRIAIVQIHAGSFGSGYPTHFAGSSVVLTDNVETTLQDTTISAANAKLMSGMFYNILLGADVMGLGPSQSLWLKAEVYPDNGLFVRPVSTTGWISRTLADTDKNGLIELGQVQIPPRLPNAGDISTVQGVVIRIKGKLIGTPSNTFFIRRLMVLPVETNRRLTSVSFHLAQNAILVDDGISERLYDLDSGGAVPLFIGKGKSLVVLPGRNTTIYFSHTLSTGNFPSSASPADVRIAYRPRVLVV